MPVFFLLAMLLGPFLLSPAAKDFEPRECTDARGLKVTIVRNDALPDLAVASLDPSGAPVIAYNRQGLAFLNPKSRVFFFLHECGHHVLAHLFGSITFAKEQQADCYAIRQLKKEGQIEEGDLSEIQQDLGRIGRGDGTHTPGLLRAQNLKWCLTDAGEVQMPVSSLAKGGFPQYCCTKSGVLGPYPNVSVPAGGECLAVDKHKRQVVGRACHDKNAIKATSYPQYCCTAAGKLGPYDNTSVPKDAPCFGTDAGGKPHAGKACP